MKFGVLRERSSSKRAAVERFISASEPKTPDLGGVLPWSFEPRSSMLQTPNVVCCGPGKAMRVSDFDDLNRFETEGLLTGSKERSWLWFGLIVSLGLHFALCAYFYRTRFQSIETLVAQNDQTPTFKVKSINTSDLGKSSVDQSNPAAKPDPDNTDVQLPDEKKSFDKLLQDI